MPRDPEKRKVKDFVKFLKEHGIEAGKGKKGEKPSAKPIPENEVSEWYIRIKII